MPPIRKFIGLPDHLVLAGNPLLPDTGDPGVPSAGGPGSPPATPPAPAPAPPVSPPAPTAPPVTGPPEGPHGYPENTPLSAMTEAQQLSYWRTHARKHEDASKSKDAELAALRPKAQAHDELLAANQTDAQRAIAEAEQRAAEAARAQAEQAARATYGRALVQARFESVLAGRMTAEQVAAMVAPLDVAAFLGADGLPDADKVGQYVTAVLPATTAPPAPPATAGRPDLGGGRTAPPAVSGLAAGRDLYAQRHPKRP